jgi:hypothetical protein
MQRVGVRRRSSYLGLFDFSSADVKGDGGCGLHKVHLQMFSGKIMVIRLPAVNGAMFDLHHRQSRCNSGDIWIW